MAILSTAALSITSPVGRAAIQSGMNPTTLIVGRFLLATFLLGITLYLSSPNQLGIERRGLVFCILAGSVNGVASLAYIWAISRMSASVTALIFSIYPLVVLILVAFRGEKFTALSMVRCGLGFLGVFLLLGPGGTVDRIGLALTLLAALAFSLYLVINQWYLSSYPTTTVTFYTLVSLTSFVTGFWLLRGAEWHPPGLSGWLSIAVLAFVGTYLARLTMFVAVRSIGSAQFALVGPLETLLTVVWSTIFLNERLSLSQWLGGGLILFSVLLAIFYVRKPQAPFSTLPRRPGEPVN